MDIDQKDLTYHYDQAIKIVNHLIDYYFDLLAKHHLSDATSCKQVSVIKAKSIEIDLLRKSGYHYDSDELFKLCQAILWGAFQVKQILTNSTIQHHLINNQNDEPLHVIDWLNELHDLINTIKYLEARLGIVHDYAQYFVSPSSQSETKQANASQSVENVKQETNINQDHNQQPNPSENKSQTGTVNSQVNDQTNNSNQQPEHPVRLQAKQVEQWLLNHFPSRQEYMDWSFQLKTIQNKLNELEQLIKTKKKPN